MNKTFSPEEFTDFANNVLMKLVDHAMREDHHNAGFRIMMTGRLIISEICSAIFDDETESITIKKE